MKNLETCVKAGRVGRYASVLFSPFGGKINKVCCMAKVFFKLMIVGTVKMFVKQLVLVHKRFPDGMLPPGCMKFLLLKLTR